MAERARKSIKSVRAASACVSERCVDHEVRAMHCLLACVKNQKTNRSQIESASIPPYDSKLACIYKVSHIIIALPTQGASEATRLARHV